jgi:hypothetical protein
MKIGKKEGKHPTVEIGVDLGSVLDGLGIGKMLDKVLGMIQDGQLELKVEVPMSKKGKVPIGFMVRLKKAER